MDSIIIFIALLLGLILCAYLGDWSIYEGFTSDTTTYYSKSGITALVNTNKTASIIISYPNGTVATYNISSKPNEPNIYYGPNDTKVTISNDDKSSIKLSSSNDVLIDTLTSTPVEPVPAATPAATPVEPVPAVSPAATPAATPAVVSYDNYNHFDRTSYPDIFYGPNGSTARIIKSNTTDVITIYEVNGIRTIYYKDVQNPDSRIYYEPNGTSIKIVTNNGNNVSLELKQKDNSTVVYTYKNIDINPPSYPIIETTVDAYNSLPDGIPKSKIPNGMEDLYILKTQILPVICPKCADVIKPSDSTSTKPELCEQCSKQKNIEQDIHSNNKEPVPVLSNFTSFGI